MRAEFAEFERITNKMAQEKDEIIDLLGNKNLCIVDVDGRPHLKFIDPHNITSSVSSEKDRLDKLQKALAYLETIKYKILKN